MRLAALNSAVSSAAGEPLTMTQLEAWALLAFMAYAQQAMSHSYVSLLPQPILFSVSHQPFTICAVTKQLPQ